MLKRLAEDELLRRNVTLDSALSEWWDSAKLETLAYFVNRRLVSPTASASRTSQIALTTILESIAVGTPLLEAEALSREHPLHRRSTEIDFFCQVLLSGKEGSNKLFDLVWRATLSNRLPTAWVEAVIARAESQDEILLVAGWFLAMRVNALQQGAESKRWPAELVTVFCQLIERALVVAEVSNSRSTPGPPGSVGRDSSTGNLRFESASVALRPRKPIGNNAQILRGLLSPTSDWHLYLNLAELTARADVADAEWAMELRLAAAKLQDRDIRRKIAKGAVDDNWRSLDPQTLVHGTELAFPTWLNDIADIIGGDDRVLEPLGHQPLIRLSLAPIDDTMAANALRHVDRSMKSEPAATTRSLIEHGLWLAWEASTTLHHDEPAIREAAVCWLSAAVWTARPPTKATRKQWDTAMELLLTVPSFEKGLSGDEMQRLVREHKGGISPRWPWIRPIEEKQFDDLCRSARDLGALAVLAEAVIAEEHLGQTVEDMFVEVVQRSGFRDDFDGENAKMVRLLSPTAVLPDPQPDWIGCLPPLRKHAGHRKEDERSHKWLDGCASIDPLTTIRELHRHSLVSSAASLRSFVKRAKRRKQDLRPLLPEIEKIAKTCPDRTYRPNPDDSQLAYAMWKNSYFDTARLFHPQINDDRRVDTDKGPKLGLTELGTQLWARTF
ncbi:MAG: hypothetical protein HN348_27640, partial [Proteobacteria bacterium]|nr:hypothetical protein [Pseudomonadota bacterium]